MYLTNVNRIKRWTFDIDYFAFIGDATTSAWADVQWSKDTVLYTMYTCIIYNIPTMQYAMILATTHYQWCFLTRSNIR